MGQPGRATEIKGSCLNKKMRGFDRYVSCRNAELENCRTWTAVKCSVWKVNQPCEDHSSDFDLGPDSDQRRRIPYFWADWASQIELSHIAFNSINHVDVSLISGRYCIWTGIFKTFGS